LLAAREKPALLQLLEPSLRIMIEWTVPTVGELTVSPTTPKSVRRFECGATLTERALGGPKRPPSATFARVF